MKLQGSWNVFRGRMKQRCARLFRDHHRYARGREQELIGRLQRRLGKSRTEVQRMLEAAQQHPGQGHQLPHWAVPTHRVG